jgi:hypothetical protein
MAWKTGAVPVVAGLGLESDANLFIYLFRKKKKELAYHVRLHAWRATLNPTTIISKASKMVEKIGDPSAATLGKLKNLNQHIYHYQSPLYQLNLSVHNRNIFLFKKL